MASKSTPKRPPPTSTPSTGLPPPVKQRRIPITNEQRKLIRDYKYRICHGEASQKAIQQYFFENTGRRLTQSTISEILSPQYAHLDESSNHHLSDMKKPHPYWPDLEAALFEWQQRMVRKNATITGDILRAMGKKFWDQLPQYRDHPPPSFSVGWLDGFKKRNSIRRRKRAGESGSVDLEEMENSLIGLRSSLSLYSLDDIFNMDETGLFWKMSPDSTLASENLHGMKLEKARITAAFCCNSTGSIKLPPWFIGQAKSPRCFGSNGINIQNFPMVWRSNAKGWMTGLIFCEWLHWFDNQVRGRSVALLIDGFSAHQTGIDLYLQQHPDGLENTTIFFLPANATSVCQPLDQGIIRTWKAYYRKRWLDYVILEFENEKIPWRSMNVLHAIRWGISAWGNDVTPATIQRCWLKSRVSSPKYGPATAKESGVVLIAKQEQLSTPETSEKADQDELEMRSTQSVMEQQLIKLAREKRIRQTMNIASFLNPIQEQDPGEEEDPFIEICAAYSDGERAYETDEEDTQEAPIKHTEAMGLLRRLRLYEEQQQRGDSEVLRQLNRLERLVVGRTAQGVKQAPITSFFGQSAAS